MAIQTDAAAVGSTSAPPAKSGARLGGGFKKKRAASPDNKSHEAHASGADKKQAEGKPGSEMALKSNDLNTHTQGGDTDDIPSQCVRIETCGTDLGFWWCCMLGARIRLTRRILIIWSGSAAGAGKEESFSEWKKRKGLQKKPEGADAKSVSGQPSHDAPAAAAPAAAGGVTEIHHHHHDSGPSMGGFGGFHIGM